MSATFAAIYGAAGLPAGVALSWLVDRLAIPFEEGEATVPAAERGDAPVPERPSSLAAEAGSLALQRPATDGATLRRVATVVATVVLFAGAGSRYPEAWQAAIVCAYIAVLLVCTVTDLLVYRVPDLVTYPGMLLALVVGLTVPGSEWERPLIGAAVAGGLLLLPSIITRGQMGMGDVKLATFGGLALGWRLALPALVVMAIAGGLAAAALLIVGRRGRRDAMPYAPYVAIGILVILLTAGTAFHTF